MRLGNLAQWTIGCRAISSTHYCTTSKRPCGDIFLKSAEIDDLLSGFGLTRYEVPVHHLTGEGHSQTAVSWHLPSAEITVMWKGWDEWSPIRPGGYTFISCQVLHPQEA